MALIWNDDDDRLEEKMPTAMDCPIEKVVRFTNAVVM